MSHTPGPWKYSLNVGPTRGLIVEEDGSTVVELRLNVRDSRFVANARLIAAAPALLAELKRLLAEYKDLDHGFRHSLHPEDIESIEATIKKAEEPK